MKRGRAVPKALQEPGRWIGAILAVLGWFRGPLRRAGVDLEHLRTVVTVERMRGTRRARAARDYGQTGLETAGAGVRFLAFVAIGGLCTFALKDIDDPLWGMALAQSVVMLLLVMGMITDLLPGLLDGSDVELLNVAPIDGRTVLAARLVHVLSHIGLSVGALSLLPVVLCSHVAPAWIPITVLTAITSLGASLALFLCAVRVFDAERFRDLVLWCQVGCMIVLVGGLHVLPRFVDFEAFERAMATRPLWMLALPPFHSAGLHALLHGAGGLAWILAFLGLAVPGATLWIVVRLTGPDFVSRLAGIAAADRGARARARARRPGRPLRDFLVPTALGRAGYDFVQALSRRERQFRLRTYPMVAFAGVYGIAMALRETEETSTATLVLALYLLTLYMPLFLVQSRQSEHHEARWIFEAAPLERPGEFLFGGVMALVVTFVLPAAALLAAVVLAVGGIQLLPDLLYAVEVVGIVALAGAVFLGRELPFSLPLSKVDQGFAQLGWAIACALLAGLLGLVQVLVRLVPPLFYTLLGVMPLVAWALRAKLLSLEPRSAWLGTAGVRRGAGGARARLRARPRP